MRILKHVSDNGNAMTDKGRIQSLLKEAEVYHIQGLLKESMDKYQEILEIVKTNEDLAIDEHIIDLVHNKIRTVAGALGEIDSEPDTTELSKEVQDLISKLFSFSKNEDTAAVESAVALATFGQYDKALKEFQRLLNEGILPRTVAKNVLMCHLSLATHEAAISQFEDWVSHSTFSREELSYLRDYLNNIFEKKGIKADLPQVKEASPDEGMIEDITEEIFEENISEILSVRIMFDDRHMKGQTRDFDVKFQLGNSVTFDIKDKEKDLLSLLEPGARFYKIHCFGSFYMFNAKGVISAKKMATVGPKQGCYSIFLTLLKP
ncbi:MAG: hypothetical protein V3T59_04275 [Desulfobacterales bacterium]